MRACGPAFNKGNETMSQREPSLISILVSSAMAGVTTVLEIVCIVVAIGSMAAAAKLLEPDRRPQYCAAGSSVAIFTDCVRR